MEYGETSRCIVNRIFLIVLNILLHGVVVFPYNMYCSLQCFSICLFEECTSG
uniref:Uncharacterized protein n=1 Tax=Arundo donax TaxID=35708 RepID=A0A0A9A4S7_ARUDO